MNKLFSFLFCAAFCLSAAAEVNYQVIPLPQQIVFDRSGQHMVLSEGMTVGYPAGNQQMKRNAEFAAEYLGLSVTADKKGADVNLTLGLKSNNPEDYAISINKKGITIQGASESGVFYGIQTLRKSIMNETSEVRLPYAWVCGSPRFGYRGTMLDCARHFFPVSFIKKFIDILALHGINRFHWHLTDDQGWRFEVKAMPELAAKASVRPCTIIGKNVGLSDPDNTLYDDTPETGYYTQEEMREIVAYAAERYITIVPEIDLPGHMIAAMSVYPELGCTGGPYKVWGCWGIADDVLCAGNPKTLEFLKTVYGELCDVFPSKLIHIGGDESPRVRWKTCPKCQAKMQELGLKEEAQLQTYINKEMEAFLAERGRQIIGWDETLEGGLSEKAAVMSWRGYEGGKAAAKLHHQVVMTPTNNCYFDYYQLKNRDAQPLGIGGYLPLSKVYSMEPVPEDLTKEEAKYIMGAQCNLWTEYVLSPDHAEYMLLPRLAAMSEVGWLQPEAKNYEQFLERLAGLEIIYRRLGYKFCTAYE
ncbi:MAG: beta-N-acetylhexosaminidase [Bacteroidaceae bacterium]|nr:beta-N-acetylhexosaminidase [Bacteroidaceae bacterium]